MKEMWKWIPSFEEHYKASNLGNIKSVNRVTDGRPNELKTIKGKQLKPAIGNGGYFRVSLCINGKRRNYSVHRLVAFTFLGKSDKKCVNHIDCNKLNNNINNLEWCTHKENTHYAMNLNKMRWRFGENHPYRKLNDEKVKSILKEYIPWEVGYYRLSKKYGVSVGVIQSIISGLTWKHIPRKEEL